MKAQIYVEAALLIELGAQNYACLAIDEVVNETYSNYTIIFERYFKPSNWFAGNSEWFGDKNVQANRDERILALLLMSEIAKTEAI